MTNVRPIEDDDQDCFGFRFESVNLRDSQFCYLNIISVDVFDISSLIFHNNILQKFQSIIKDCS